MPLNSFIRSGSAGGKIGGKIGGKRRLETMTPEERSAVARLGSLAVARSKGSLLDKKPYKKRDKLP